MKKIVKRTAVISKFLDQPDVYFEEEGTGRTFRRIVGGMQWPGANPGALVVVAEDLRMDPDLEERKLRVLGEYENRNPSEIIARCEELKGFLEVEKFYGDTTNRPMMTLMRRSEAKIRLSKASFVDEPDAPATYLSLIREKIKPCNAQTGNSATKKVLYFEKESALPAMLLALSGMPTDLSDFPKIAALGYALYALTVRYEKARAYNAGHGVLDPVVGY